MSAALLPTLQAVLDAADAPTRTAALDDLYRLVIGTPARDQGVLDRLGDLVTAAHGRGRAEERQAHLADINALRARLKGEA